MVTASVVMLLLRLLLQKGTGYGGGRKASHATGCPASSSESGKRGRVGGSQHAANTRAARRRCRVKVKVLQGMLLKMLLLPMMMMMMVGRGAAATAAAGDEV